MQNGNAACELTGIPPLHAEAFQEVADQKNCMISSRAVGRYATGPILEGYASKGFHNKAKSCNWGPMAGFVLNDPRFTKVGGTEAGQTGQKKALEKAVEEGATAVPLFISDARRRWLEKNALIRTTGMTADRVLCLAAAPWGPVMKFTLTRERPTGATMDMWGVCYEASASAPGLMWVMAMRDPHCALDMSDYRSATTGDYDLFAIFARAGDYRPAGRDQRMVSNKQLESNIRAGVAPGEDKHLGNITGRAREIRDALNTAIIRRGYTGGNMVHHSDEGGRPFVEDVDLPVFAVVPGKTAPYGIESVEDLREFISTILEGYAPVFNPGWMKQLVFHSDPKKAAMIHAQLLSAISRRA
jgi:hypothetical protein